MRLMFIVIGVTALSLVGTALSQPSSMHFGAQAHGDAPGTAILRAERAGKLKSFLEDFVDGRNTPEEQLAFFADSVHYYDQGLIDKKRIAKDIQYTMRRWPWRRNRLVEIEYLKQMPEEGMVFVSFVVDYEVSNSRRVIYGTARYGATISGVDTQPRIESIAENVTKRKAESPFQATP